MNIVTARTRVLPTAALVAVGALSLGACSAPSDSPAQSSDGTTPDIAVSAAFYPLEFVAETVAGDHASILQLTAPGVEPHDLELSPAVVRSLQDQDVVLYLSDFQPAVDAALEATGAHGFNVADAVQLHPAEEHAHEEGEDEEHDHGTTDPHFWLDPTLLATYATAIGEEFSSLDPANAAEYEANAAALVDDLNALDESFSTGLAKCEQDEIFVTHEAFGYLAQRYDLHQEGLSGIDPEAEPSPARVREIRDLMAASGATTIFTESLVSANVAEALASDAGVATEVLDPLEGVMGDDDYMTVMERNLETLRGALVCS